MSSDECSSREAAWRSRLARFHDSGLSVVEFCRGEGVSPPSFYQWRKRLGPDRQPFSATAPAAAPGGPVSRFVPVTVAAAAIAEVEFPNGVRIRVPATNLQALRAAVLAGHDLCREVP